MTSLPATSPPPTTAKRRVGPWGAIRLLAAFARRDGLNQLSYKLAFVSQLAALASSVLTVYFLSRLVDSSSPALLGPYGGEYFAFAIVGLVVADYFTVALRGFGAAVRNAMVEGQLEAMLATPAPPSLIIVGTGLHSFAWTVARSAVLLITSAALGADWSGARWDVFAVVLALCILVASALGTIGAALTLVVKKGEPLTAAIAGTTLLLGGVLYPVTSLPAWLQPAARALPPTQAIEAGRRALLAGAGWSDAAAPVTLLAIAWLVAALAAAVALRWAVARLTRDGSADQF